MLREILSRRLFFKLFALIGAAILGLPIKLSPVSQKLLRWSGLWENVSAFPARLPGRVIVAGYPGTFDLDSLARDGVAGMLSSSMCTLTGERDVVRAWRRLFGENDVVGIKLNCLAGRGLSPHPVLVEAIVDGLVLAGVSADKIIIWDRTDEDLRRAGYDIRTSRPGPLCYGTNASYDWNDLTISGAVGSCFSPIVSKLCTALISVPVLKDHDLAGVSLSLKNFYGAIHNPNKYHDNSCDPYVADLNAHQYIRGKLRLTVCDALRGQWHGGPAYKPQWSWPCGKIIVSTDPVALDAVGLKMIEEKRLNEGMSSLTEVGRYPTYLQTAEKAGLGIAARQEIKIVTV